MDVEEKLREYENRVTVLVAEIEKHIIIYNDQTRECEGWKELKERFDTIRI